MGKNLFDKYFIKGFIGLVVLPLIYVTLNIQTANSNVSEEYNRLKNLPENNRLVESYRLYNGPIPPILWKAAENVTEKLEKQDGIKRIINCPQLAYLKATYPAYGYFGQYQ